MSIAETIPTIGAYAGTIPDKATQTQEEFANNVYPFHLYYNDTFITNTTAFSSSLNTFADEANELAVTVNADAAKAESARDIAIGLVNYKGDWVAGSYNQGESVTYTDGLIYISKINSNTTEPTAGTSTTEWYFLNVKVDLTSEQTISALKTFSSSIIINGMTPKTPIDADSILISDSQSSNLLKKMTWANAKNSIKLGTLDINNFFHARDEKPNGTNGGGSSVGVQDRTLNAVVTNNITGASLSASKVTLPAGDYYIEATAPCIAGDDNRIYITDDADNILLLGNNGFTSSSNSVLVLAKVSGKLTLGASTNIKIRHYISVAAAVVGLGADVADGEIEIYADIEIYKVG